MRAYSTCKIPVIVRLVIQGNSVPFPRALALIGSAGNVWNDLRLENAWVG